MSQTRNYYQEWKDKKRRAAEEHAQEGEAEDAAWAAALGPEHGIGSEEPTLAVAGIAPEAFQWTEERDRAIQELLESTAPGTLPAVHVQLQSIHNGLLTGGLDKERATMLLAEVDGYLQSLIRQEENRVQVDHEGFVSAREDKLRALSAWQESSNSLRQFIEKDEKVFLDVATYAADQGSAFLAASRRQLLESEPEPEPEFEDEDEDEEPM